MRTLPIRTEVQRLIRHAPFRRFAIDMENGDRLIVEHPENLAFDPAESGSEGSDDFYVITKQLRVFGTFDAVTSVMLVDQGGRRGKH